MQRKKTRTPFDCGVSLESPVDACIDWPGYTRSDGYGTIKFRGEPQLSHRWIWSQFNGAIPYGMVVCHKCDRRNCINIHHLFLGTQADNIADMVSKGRQHKPIGSSNPRSKLTSDQVKRIREARQLHGKNYGCKKLADEFGVSMNQISGVANGRYWVENVC